MITKKISGLLLAATLLGGCVAPQKTLYSWDGYQTTVYQHYQPGSSSPEQQIAALKESIEKSRAKDKAVPPGLHAHLGMLYANTGRADQALAEFNTEKSLFPESAPFMDFLMSKDKGSFK
ncbi:lipoprotein [Chania multitudinisentens RB-25]|uniref:Lipoprotein n=2 Tax=Chania TaxID=1745211 RepID=W0LIA4_9GAMM|nr:lipoprotein [Chania multitudinisentens RB-25]